MDRTERFYKIDQLISERTVVSFDALREALEISPATLKRDIQYLRDRLNAPIMWDREAGGYRYERDSAPAGSQFELPGLWFTHLKSMPCSPCSIYSPPWIKAVYLGHIFSRSWRV